MINTDINHFTLIYSLSKSLRKSIVSYSLKLVKIF